jgi:hypothetical protein
MLNLLSSKSLFFFLLLCFGGSVYAFKWVLTDVLPANRILQFSERYMFANHEGPDLLAQGESYIDINVNVISYMEVNRSTEVGFAVYAANVGHEHQTLLGMCSKKNAENVPAVKGSKGSSTDDEVDIHVNTWAANVFAQRVVSEYLDTVNIRSSHFGGDMDLPNGTYHRWSASVATRYTVNTEAWHNVAFELCDTDTVDPKAHVNGTVTFHNPYGYLPAELFGFLPFECARMGMFAIFGSYYLYQFCKYRSSSLSLHKATLAVFLVAFIEAASWFVAYQTINNTGTPYCCPFPSTVVVALVLQVFRQTFSRMLLLVVVLGYGIVRPRLLAAEWVAVSIVTALYFVGAIVALVSEIVMVHDVHDDSPEHVLAWQVPAMVLDVILLSWIYLALGSTIRILTEFKQTNKLKMFTSLNRVITVFVGLFSITTGFVLLDKANILAWPWQFAWLEAVLWEILNFGILAAVCIICKPSENSLLLSYASQLPTEDPEDDDTEVDRYDDVDIDEESSRGGIEMKNVVGNNFNSNVIENPVISSQAGHAKRLSSFRELQQHGEDEDSFDLDDSNEGQ